MGGAYMGIVGDADLLKTDISAYQTCFKVSRTVIRFLIGRHVTGVTHHIVMLRHFKHQASLPHRRSTVLDNARTGIPLLF